jgi:hypothetical protein
MKYLVNRETKEHTIAPEWAIEELCLINGYILVEADDEGWIPWSGGKRPLPRDCKVAIILDEAIYDQDRAGDWGWRDDSLTAYRPILSETAEKEVVKESFTTESVFDRLKSAIAASESIPGIIAEIDAMLPEGYCVVQSVQPPTLDLQPAEDMSDWRNWRKGDILQATRSSGGGYVEGNLYIIKQIYGSTVDTEIDSKGHDDNGWDVQFFRFHSRPAKVAEK